MYKRMSLQHWHWDFLAWVQEQDATLHVVLLFSQVKLVVPFVWHVQPGSPETVAWSVGSVPAYPLCTNSVLSFTPVTSICSWCTWMTWPIAAFRFEWNISTLVLVDDRKTTRCEIGTSWLIPESSKSLKNTDWMCRFQKRSDVNWMTKPNLGWDVVGNDDTKLNSKWLSLAMTPLDNPSGASGTILLLGYLKPALDEIQTVWSTPFFNVFPAPIVRTRLSSAADQSKGRISKLLIFLKKNLK